MSGFTLNWDGDTVLWIVERAIKKGLIMSAIHLKGKSSKEAPIELGDLRGNCSVDDSKISELKVRVGYSLPYALRQHEEVEYKHPKGGKAKFLEDPYNKNKDKYTEFVAERISRALR